MITEEKFIAMYKTKIQGEQSTIIERLKKEYQSFKSARLVGICAATLLVDIQCTLPPYYKNYILDQKRYTLDGFPLDKDADNMQTVEYMSHMLLSLYKKDKYPWRDITELKDTTKEKQVAYMQKQIMIGITYLLKVDSINLALYKRHQFIDTFTTIDEQIPPYFLPAIMHNDSLSHNPDSNNAAENAKTYKNHMIQIKKWIRMAHAIAKKTTDELIIRQIVLLENTCAPVNITTPGLELPPFTIRSLLPKTKPTVFSTFRSRHNTLGDIFADKSLYYRVFLKYCVTGENEGNMHELGLTNMCRWCNITIMSNEYSKYIVNGNDKDDKNKYDTIMRTRVADFQEELTTKGIVINDASFMELLNKVHKTQIVDSFEKLSILPLYTGTETAPDIDTKTECISPPVQEDEDSEEKTDDILYSSVIDKFIKIPSTIISYWRKNTLITFKNYLTFVNDASKPVERKIDVLSTCCREYKRIIMGQYKSEHITIINNICALPWNAFCNVLQTYFVIPFQRVRTGFTRGVLDVPKEIELIISDNHRDNLEELLQNETAFSVNYNIQKLIEGKTAKEKITKQEEIQEIKNIMNTDFVSMITRFTAFLSSITQFKNKLCFRQIVDNDSLVTYLKQYILYGSLLITNTDMNKWCKTIFKNAIATQLFKYNKEQLSFNAKEIATLIEAENERERRTIIADFDKIEDPDEKKVELEKKRLGIGKWAVGGTSKIYKYDPDYFDLELTKFHATNESGPKSGYDNAQFNDDD